MGAILPSLVIAALVTALFVFAQFLAMPAISRRLTPLPAAQLLRQGNAAAAGQPARGRNSLDAFRRQPASGNTLPRGDEERRRTLLVGLQARLRRSTPSAPGETLSAELHAVLEQEPLAVLEALTANLRPVMTWRSSSIHGPPSPAASSSTS